MTLFLTLWNYTSRKERGDVVAPPEKISLKFLTPKQMREMIDTKELLYPQDQREIVSIQKSEAGFQMVIYSQFDFDVMEYLEEIDS